MNRFEIKSEEELRNSIIETIIEHSTMRDCVINLCDRLRMLIKNIFLNPIEMSGIVRINDENI